MLSFNTLNFFKMPNYNLSLSPENFKIQRPVVRKLLPVVYKALKHLLLFRVKLKCKVKYKSFGFHEKFTTSS